MQTTFTSDERESICQTLGDSPFTVISIHQIRRGDVNMVLVGSPTAIKGLVIQSHRLLEEPTAFGIDAHAMWHGLNAILGWTCVNVPRDLADEVAGLMQNKLDAPIRHYHDVHYQLDTPIIIPHHLVIDGVVCRFLLESDIGVLDNAPAELLTSNLGDYVAGAIADGRMVAIAHAHALSDTYADVGVSTDDVWRQRGISTYLASLVMRKLQADGFTPVWSTGQDNHASKRVAEKLGMTHHGDRVYLIPQETE